MTRRTNQFAALVTALVSLASCSSAPTDPRCRATPPDGADYGDCALILGYYFDARRLRCVPLGGCNCDSTCNLPFHEETECRTACETAR